MRVEIERRIGSRRLDVFFFDYAGRERWLWRWRDGEWHRDDYDEAAQILEPTISFEPEMLEELVRAAEGHVHAQDATVRHLDDAIATRDRLLTLVERRPAEA